MANGTARLYYFKMAAFAVISVVTVLGILALQVPMLILWFPYRLGSRLFPGSRRRWVALHRLYRGYIRIFEAFFGSFVVFLLWSFLPGSQLILTGAHEAMSKEAHLIAMANHQIYPDWLYLWALAWSHQRHGDVKILLMSVLKHIPLLGIGMLFFEFIFLERKWELDRERIERYLLRSLDDGYPTWLLLFPEGTLNTPNNRLVSEKYATKMGIKDQPKFVILPKSTGLLHCTQILHPHVNKLFDITVGYSGLNATDIPYYYYLFDHAFFGGKYPRSIHLHVREYVTVDIPGFKQVLADSNSAEGKEAFGHWLRTRFMEKDKILHDFYDSHHLREEGQPENRLVVPLVPKAEDLLCLVGVWISIFWTFPIYGLFFHWIKSII